MLYSLKATGCMQWWGMHHVKLMSHQAGSVDLISLVENMKGELSPIVPYIPTRF